VGNHGKNADFRFDVINLFETNYLAFFEDLQSIPLQTRRRRRLGRLHHHICRITNTMPHLLRWLVLHDANPAKCTSAHLQIPDIGVALKERQIMEFARTVVCM
jgi:hypothetical protein